jgi:hypothetical protein
MVERPRSAHDVSRGREDAATRIGRGAKTGAPKKAYLRRAFLL